MLRIHIVVNVKAVFLSSIMTKSTHSPYKTTLFHAVLFCIGNNSGSGGFCQIHGLESELGKTLMSFVGLHNLSVCGCSSLQ